MPAPIEPCKCDVTVQQRRTRAEATAGVRCLKESMIVVGTVAAAEINVWQSASEGRMVRAF